jgi:hypothetical protein
LKNTVLKFLLVGTVLAGLTACSSEEQYVIKADQAQLGVGSTLTMSGKAGRLHVVQLPAYPTGFDVAVSEVQRINPPMANTLMIEADNKMVLTFLISAGQYICDSCVSYQLPRTWHRDDLTKK